MAFKRVSLSLSPMMAWRLRVVRVAARERGVFEVVDWGSIMRLWRRCAGLDGRYGWED
jgi:hypothetical protein